MSRTRSLMLAGLVPLLLGAALVPALAADPGATEVVDRARAQAQRDYDKAVRLTRSGRATEALEHYEKALPYLNTGADIFYNLVMVSEAAKRWDKVHLYAQGFLALEASSPDAPEIRGKLDIAGKRLEKGGKKPVAVSFIVDPPEARVLISEVPLITAGQLTAELAPGRYQVKAELADHDGVTMPLEVKAGEAAGPIALTLTKRVYQGTLAIKTTPPAGVEVFIDDKSVGVTPLEPMTLPTLRYLVRLEKPGFDRWVRYVQLEKDSVNEVKATLEATKTK